MTLLEVMAATTIMATLMGSVVVLVRSSYSVWQAHEGDLERAENSYSVLRHLVRNIRQADGVAAISAAGNSSGSLSLNMESGETRKWAHNAALSQVLYGTTLLPPTELLADQINELAFIGYEADGVTTTSIVDDIRLIRCVVRITMPAGGGQPRTLACWAWLRSW